MHYKLKEIDVLSKANLIYRYLSKILKYKKGNKNIISWILKVFFAIINQIFDGTTYVFTYSKYTGIQKQNMINLIIPVFICC